MNNIFFLKPNANITEIKNALYENNTKAKAISASLLIAHSDKQSRIYYDAIWAIDGYLEQIDSLQERLGALI